MMTSGMNDALNQQLNAELFSSYLYLSMAAYSSSNGLRGAASWFFVQSQEELAHVQRIYGYLNSVGGSVTLAAIEGPQTDFESLRDMFEVTLNHEKKVTGLINDLADLAVADRDHATQIFLQWFVTEQVEEEESVCEVLDKLKLVGNDMSALLMLDNELGTRVFAMPADMVAQ